MKSLHLLWRFKWAAVFTLIAEWLILIPVLLLLISFGNKAMAINLAITPIGSSEFVAILMDAMRADQRMSLAFFTFLLLIPVLFMTKLALATGTISSMQQGHWRLSTWLSESGTHLLRAIGLLLRWLIIPILLCSLAYGLQVLINEDSKVLLLSLMGVSWLLSLSWLFIALNSVAAKQRWALKNAAVILYKNIGRVALAGVIFAALVALLQWVSWSFFVANSAPASGLGFAITGAIAIALFVRLIILYWQGAHTLIWQRHSA